MRLSHCTPAVLKPVNFPNVEIYCIIYGSGGLRPGKHEDDLSQMPVLMEIFEVSCERHFVDQLKGRNICL